MVRFILLYLISLQLCFGGFERQFRTAGIVGTGSTGIACQSEGWILNPALLAGVKNWQVTGSFHPQPFGIEDLSEGGVACCGESNVVNFSGVMFLFGNPLYKELTGTASLGCCLANFMSVGGSVHYYNQSIKNYGTNKAIGFDIGLSNHLFSGIDLGALFQNVNTPRLGSLEEQLPFRSGIGIHIQFLPSLVLSVETWNEKSFPASIRYGIEFSPIRSLNLFFGSSTTPDLLAGGFRISSFGVQVEYAAEYHQILGLSHFVTFSIPLRITREDISGIPPAECLLSNKINLNKASITDLMAVHGLKSELAERMILYRNSHNGFKSLDEILQVEGITPTLFKKINEYFFMEKEP